MNLSNRETPIYSIEWLVELGFSLSGITISPGDGVSKELRRYSNLDELLREFERGIEGLRFRKYISKPILKTFRKFGESIVAIYSEEENWFRSENNELLFYTLKKTLYQENDKILGGEFELNGIITASIKVAGNFKRVLKSVFVLENPIIELIPI